MLLVDDLAAGGTKNLRHTPRGLVTLFSVALVVCVCMGALGQGRIQDFWKVGFICIKVWGFAVLIYLNFLKYPMKMK